VKGEFANVQEQGIPAGVENGCSKATGTEKHADTTGREQIRVQRTQVTGRNIMLQQ